jgi:hypothetical protein
MTATYVLNTSFTISDARYVGAKIAADLRLLHNLYGRPTLSDIDDYAEEVALLLKDSYLGTVDYGFLRPDATAWALRLRYRATAGGQLIDSRPGSLPPSADLAGLSFHSYLTYSAKFNDLASTERDRIKGTLPVKRVGAEAPTANIGATTGGHGYARNGAGVARDVYVAY